MSASDAFPGDAPSQTSQERHHHYDALEDLKHTENFLAPNVEIWIDIENPIGKFFFFLLPVFWNQNQVHLVYRTRDGTPRTNILCDQKLAAPIHAGFRHDHPIESQQAISNLADVHLHGELVRHLATSDQKSLVLIVSEDSLFKASLCSLTAQFGPRFHLLTGQAVQAEPGSPPPGGVKGSSLAITQFLDQVDGYSKVRA